MLGYLEVRIFANGMRQCEYDFDHEDKTFDDLRASSLERLPQHKIAEMQIWSRNDDPFSVIDEIGTIRDVLRHMEGPNNQQYGDAIVDVTMEQFGMMACKCGNEARFICSRSGEFYCGDRCANK